jgi:hypothetical protein
VKRSQASASRPCDGSSIILRCYNGISSSLQRGPWNFDFLFNTKRHNLEKDIFGAI